MVIKFTKSRKLPRHRFCILLRQVTSDVGTNDEPMFQAKMIANLAAYTNNATLFCMYAPQLWRGLDLAYPTFQHCLDTPRSCGVRLTSCTADAC